MNGYRHAELSSHGDRNLMLQGVKANGVVMGRVLEMTMQQLYRNAGKRNMEITYTFPLPQQAVLMEVEVEINGRKLTGEVAPRRLAREKYEAALSQGDSSIMLEKNHDGSYTLELGNLMAGEECRITVRYTQILPTEHGQVRLMLPTTIAPRYGNPITQGKLQTHQVPVTSLFAEYPFDIIITLTGDMASANVASPSHKTGYSHLGDTVVISLAQKGRLDRDFILVLSQLKNNAAALACPDLYEPGQFALMASFSPRLGLGSAESAEQSMHTGIMAKVLVDCSGSMAGDSMEAAKRALQGIVNGLTEADRISLSRFGSTVEHRSHGFWGGTRQAKASATRWIENLEADLGGTEMEAALLSTFSQAEGKQSDILLITDGEINAIDAVLQTATESLHRVFVVAIGASPAEVHLRRLAAETGGHCDFVAPGEDVEPAVLRMSARMRSTRASVTRIEWPAGLKLRWQQAVPSYVFEDDEFNVCAFADTLHQDTRLEVKLWGRIEGHKGKVLLAAAPLIVTESSSNVMARLVAHARYQELSRAKAKIGAPSSLSATQDLAVKYRLVTEDTNFVLVHERAEHEKAEDMPDGHKVPQMLAAGWGGTGSVTHVQLRTADMDDDIPVCESPLSSTRNAKVDSMATPSVWRTRGRTPTEVKFSHASGMDDFEIPAFLRKVDEDVPAPTPTIGARLRQSISKLYSKRIKDESGQKDENSVPDFNDKGITPLGLQRWLSVNPESLWPKTYAGLQNLGLAQGICEWLEFEVGDDRPEGLVVGTFLLVVRDLPLKSEQSAKRIGRGTPPKPHLWKVAQFDDRVALVIRGGLEGITTLRWSVGIVNFPEVAPDL